MQRMNVFGLRPQNAIKQCMLGWEERENFCGVGRTTFEFLSTEERVERRSLRGYLNVLTNILSHRAY